MIILGVDPGTLFTGFAVISGVNEKLKLLKADIIKNPAKNSLPIRLKKIYDGLVDVIELYKPDEFAIETAFYGKNVQSTFKLGHARGVSILAAVNKQIPTTEYSPREVKKSVSGLGAASKEQVRFMVCSTLSIKESTLSKKTDISDAIAVALCHHNRMLAMIDKKKSGLNSQITKKTKKYKTSSGAWTDFVKENPGRVLSERQN